MKFKKLIPYIIVFFISFFLTPIIITSFIRAANKQATQYIENFYPVTSELSDGLYTGKFKVFQIITFSKVEFTIENGMVKSIDFLKMYHSPGSPYKEEIENQIKQSQSLEVDAITGATRTSNFAKAAIKNAVKKQSN
ncbi:FMN-binding protein [Bacteroidota bacterium]